MSAQTHEPSDQSDTQRRQRYLDQTHEFWQSRTARQLTQEDAREIAENLLGFFRMLHDWTRTEKEQSIRDTYRTPVGSSGGDE